MTTPLGINHANTNAWSTPFPSFLGPVQVNLPGVSVNFPHTMNTGVFTVSIFTVTLWDLSTVSFPAVPVASFLSLNPANS